MAPVFSDLDLSPRRDRPGALAGGGRGRRAFRGGTGGGSRRVALQASGRGEGLEPSDPGPRRRARPPRLALFRGAGDGGHVPVLRGDLRERRRRATAGGGAGLDRIGRAEHARRAATPGRSFRGRGAHLRPQPRGVRAPGRGVAPGVRGARRLGRRPPLALRARGAGRGRDAPGCGHRRQRGGRRGRTRCHPGGPPGGEAGGAGQQGKPGDGGRSRGAGGLQRRRRDRPGGLGAQRGAAVRRADGTPGSAA